MFDISDSNINNKGAPKSHLRRHRSLDLRVTKQIQKKPVSSSSPDEAFVIYSDIELHERRQQLERLCDEFEKMNDGSAYRRFLMSRLDPYIIDVKMDDARPVLCDKCARIIPISSCKTCDTCLSFHCKDQCALTHFTKDQGCCFCGEFRSSCDLCVKKFVKCSLCTSLMCRDCVENKINTIRKCKCGKKIYCGSTSKCNKKPKCKDCKGSFSTLKRKAAKNGF